MPPYTHAETRYRSLRPETARWHTRSLASQRAPDTRRANPDSASRTNLSVFGGDGVSFDLRRRDPGCHPRCHRLSGHALSGRKSVKESAREAAEKRFRPVLMTTLVAILGLMPAAILRGIGSETQKPLAIAVIGGSLILALLTHIIRPPLLLIAHEWRENRSIRPAESTCSVRAS
jgi:hypothetical protein